jgi:hypothetical protein
MGVPIWLQALLGVFSLLDPGMAWLAPIIKIAWELISKLPIFHRGAPIAHLIAAVRIAKQTKDVSAIETFNAHLKGELKAKGIKLPSDLQDERDEAVNTDIQSASGNYTVKPEPQVVVTPSTTPNG